MNGVFYDGYRSSIKKFRSKYKRIKKKQKMTIDELAEKSSLSGKYLQGVEVGNRNISIKNLNKICKALETSPDILLNMKPYNLKTSEEKIFAISEKLKKFEENKLDFIGNMIDHLNNIIKNEEKNE